MVADKLQGKVALITGASSGIGAAIAADLASRGCNLVLCGRDYDRLLTTQEKCLKLADDYDSDFLLVDGDLAMDDDLKNVVQRTIDHFQRLDILVNNAGVARISTLEDMTMDEYRMVMRINVDAPVYLSKLCAPHLEKTKGTIINISSNASTCAFAGSLAYCVSKAALDHVTRCLALELAPKGIRVNAINPGLVHTNIFKNAGIPDFVVDHIVSDENAVNCLGRCGRLDDITGAVRFLTSGAPYTTGATLFVNGGWHNQYNKQQCNSTTSSTTTDDNGNTLADLKSLILSE